MIGSTLVSALFSEMWQLFWTFWHYRIQNKIRTLSIKSRFPIHFKSTYKWNLYFASMYIYYICWSSCIVPILPHCNCLYIECLMPINVLIRALSQNITCTIWKKTSLAATCMVYSGLQERIAIFRISLSKLFVFTWKLLFSHIKQQISTTCLFDLTTH